MRSRIARAGTRQVVTLAAGLVIAVLVIAVGGAGPAQARQAPAAAPVPLVAAAFTPGPATSGGSSRQPAVESVVSDINLAGPVGIVAVTGGIGGLVAGLVRRRLKAAARGSDERAS